MRNYIVAAVGDWNKEIFVQKKITLEGEWHYVDTPEALDRKLEYIKPKYIFFIHWRWIVGDNILSDFECVCFHMTDVPYGRGGSPLQNLIVKGHTETVLTALRMEKTLDTGPVYYKMPLSLLGSAHSIYKRATQLSWKMILKFVIEVPVPENQNGEPVIFKRRKPEDGELLSDFSPEKAYDYIRMLDAPGYPPAFIDYGNLRLEFDNAELHDGEVTASVKIRIKV